jgi:acylphosphatase
VSAKRLRIAGSVQGVGFRDWMVRQASQLGVAGWVRNRGDGTVEALVTGDTAAVEELLRACRRGPPGASVTLIHEDLVDPAEAADLDPRFQRRPTQP